MHVEFACGPQILDQRAQINFGNDTSSSPTTRKMLTTAAPRLLGRHASVAAAAAMRPASSLFLMVRRNAAASPFSSLTRQTTTPPTTAIRFLAIKHTGNRLAGQQRSALITRFSTSSSSSTPASGGSGGNAGGPHAMAEESLTKVGRLKDLWRKYGIVAIATYLSMYGVVLGSIYVAIDQGWVSTKKPSRSDNKNGDGDDGDEDFNLVTATNRYVIIDPYFFVIIGHLY